jgi:hypothetical protein
MLFAAGADRFIFFAGFIKAQADRSLRLVSNPVSPMPKSRSVSGSGVLT